MSKMAAKSRRAPNPSTRIRHIVEAGQSLASIALKEYGDARFAKLIFTINRGEIPIRCDGFNTFAFVAPAQSLFLPTLEEASIYEDHFFTETSRIKFNLAHYARPAMPSDNLELGSTKVTNNGGKTASANHTVAVEKSDINNNQPVFHSVSESIKGTNKAEKQQSYVDAPKAPSAPYLHVVADHKTSQPQSTFDMSPPVANRIPAMQNVDNSLHHIVTKEKQRQAEMADDHELFFSQGTLEITSLSHYCRLMKFESMENESDLMIKLQVFDQNKWQTIASYVVRREATRRHALYADGSSATVNLDLPRDVVKELSVSDFSRNWKNYTMVYFNHIEKIRLGQVNAQTKMMLHAV